MAVPVVLILLHLCLVVLLVFTTIGVKTAGDSRPAGFFCMKDAGEHCKPRSKILCCKDNMDCQAYPAPGTNDNSTGAETCCLVRDAPCPKIGSGSHCCPGLSCEKISSSSQAMKCRGLAHRPE